MSDLADALLERIADARQALRHARQAGELYVARVHAGELDSLYRLAEQNGIPIPSEPESTSTPSPDA